MGKYLFNRWLISAVIGLVVGFAPQISQSQAISMSNEDMKAKIIGNSMEGDSESGDHYVEYYDPSGKIIGLSKKDGLYEGTWRFRQDNLMCFKYGDGPTEGGCVKLSLSGDKVALTRVDGSTEPTATLIKGKAPQIK